jgi:hypothetical protein
MLEERKNLLTATARTEEQQGYQKAATLQWKKCEEVQSHIERVREMLLKSTSAMGTGIKPKH